MRLSSVTGHHIHIRREASNNTNSLLLLLLDDGVSSSVASSEDEDEDDSDDGESDSDAECRVPSADSSSNSRRSSIIITTPGSNNPPDNHHWPSLDELQEYCRHFECPRSSQVSGGDDDQLSALMASIPAEWTRRQVYEYLARRTKSIYGFRLIPYPDLMNAAGSSAAEELHVKVREVCR